MSELDKSVEHRCVQRMRRYNCPCVIVFLFRSYLIMIGKCHTKIPSTQFEVKIEVKLGFINCVKSIS